MPLLGWVTDGGAGHRVRSIGASVLAGGWQERGHLDPMQLGAVDATSIAGLELLMSVKAGFALAIGDGFHPSEAEGGGFRLIVDLDVEFVLCVGHLHLLRDRPGAFHCPLTPGRPAITPLGVRKGIYLSSVCN